MIKVIVFILFLFLIATAYHYGFGHLLSDDRSREDKWAEYEHRKDPPRRSL